MSNRSITSQEYKLMLKAERFQNRTEGSNGFMTLVATLVENQGGQTTKSFHEKERRVWYLDTPTFALRQNGFILRLHSEMEATKPFNLTLKCRHSDRYLAASTKVSVSEEAEATYKEDRGDIESKFEADILGQSVGKFSHSTSIRMNKYPELRTVAEIAAIFPVLEALPVNKDTPIVVVNGFEAYEIKCEAGEIDFGQKPKVKPCLSFWYRSDRANSSPLVAEFSFDYDVSDKERKRLKKHPNQLEQFPVPVVAKADAFFQALQNHLSWLDLEGSTKTAFVYTI